MTAINVGIHPAGTHGFIVSDGVAAHTGTGVIEATDVQKVLWLPQPRLALGYRGRTKFRPIIHAVFDTFAGLDDAAAGFPERARKFRSMIGEFMPEVAPVAFEMEILAVGWSAQVGRIQAFVANTSSAEPFEPVFEDRILAPFAAGELDRAYWPSRRQATLDPNAIPAALRRCMEIQRETAVQHVIAGTRGADIGGRVTMMTITRDGCEERALFEWPDVVGERLNTDPGIGGWPRAIAA